jgi:FAD/FMN-containing dehydrogenase
VRQDLLDHRPLEDGRDDLQLPAGFLVDEAGAGGIALMREIKRALDPKNIMNPGKIFAL